MAQPAYRHEQPTEAPQGRADLDAAAAELPPLTIDQMTEAAILSPARRMQSTLSKEFSAAEEVEAPWSPRATAAFVMLSCGAFWGVVYLVVATVTG